ncbi:MAG: hypothetical protein ACI9R8_001877, partial [Candidatus Paceibacteria bacterium]
PGTPPCKQPQGGQDKRQARKLLGKYEEVSDRP